MAHADRRREPLTQRRTAALLLLLAPLAGCTPGSGADGVPDGRVVQGPSRVEPGPSCSPPAAVGTALPTDYPVAVALPEGAVLTGVQQAEGLTLVTGRVEGTAGQLLAHFRAALPEAGLLVGRDEDEGRGGELTFLGGASEGSVTVGLLRCPAGSAQFTLAARTTR